MPTIARFAVFPDCFLLYSDDTLLFVHNCTAGTPPEIVIDPSKIAEYENELKLANECILPDDDYDL